MRKINKKVLQKKKIAILIFIVILAIFMIVLFSLYLSQKNVRDWIDINILRKTLAESDAETISLNTDKTNQIHVYNDFISILSDKSLSIYNSFGENLTSIDVNINSCIFDSSEKYLVIAENKGNEICLILDKTYLWSATTDSEILQVHVNKNGYVAVVSTDITHKSVVILYNPEGKKLFTSYFSSTRIVDASISDDNKYIAIGELNLSGAVIQSNVKILSIENAQKKPENTIINTFNIDSDSLITNVEYQQGGQIACIYDNKAIVINNESQKEIINYQNGNILYVSNELRNNIVYVEEKSEGIFDVSSSIHIVNTLNNQEKLYKLEDIVKQIYTKGNVIALNTGTEIYFINTSGWLIKKYSSNQEITNVKISDGLAVVIYKDKIEIIKL